MMNKKLPVIFGFYGSSNTGKTTLVIELITWLKQQDFQVASIKKTDKPLHLDQKGKDTEKHKTAGASPVVFSSSIETNIIYPKPLEEKEIINIINSATLVDVILIEGCTDNDVPKIRMDSKCTIRGNTIFTFENNIETIKNYIMNELQKRKIV